MEELFLRFSHLTTQIFKNLSDESLARSKIVARSWSLFLDEEKFYWKRIINKYVFGQADLDGNWKLVTEKANFEMIKALGMAVRNFLTISPLPSAHNYIKPIAFSPMDFAVDAGHTLLVKFVLGRMVNINSNNLYRWTPFHSAAVNGHLEICLSLMSKTMRLAWGPNPS